MKKIRTDKSVLDVTAGTRSMWHDKENPDVVFSDLRDEVVDLSDGRSLEVAPDYQCDFTDLPFASSQFNLVVFDPPHLESLGWRSDLAKKYGVLSFDWRLEIKLGFKECFRVLKPGGVLIFKWNEYQVPLQEILKLTPMKPLFGNRSGKQGKTIWVSFLKPNGRKEIMLKQSKNQNK